MIAGVHVDLLELVWLMIAAGGLGLVVDELRVSRADCALLLAEQAVTADADRRNRAREFELERTIVGGDIVAAWWLIGFQTANVLVGVLAAFTAPPAHGRTATTWAIIVLLLLAAAAVPARSYGRRTRRRRLLRITDDRAPGSP